MSAPIERTLHVRCGVEHAYDVFTRRLDAWWPVGHRRFEGSTLTLDPQPGGRFVERAPDGREALLGEVLHAERPHALTYTWHPGALTAPTEVDIRFTADGDRTRVDVTHREAGAAMGERWPDRAILFARAWSHVLPAYIAHIARAADPDPRS